MFYFSRSGPSKPRKINYIHTHTYTHTLLQNTFSIFGFDFSLLLPLEVPEPSVKKSEKKRKKQGKKISHLDSVLLTLVLGVSVAYFEFFKISINLREEWYEWTVAILDLFDLVYSTVELRHHTTNNNKHILLTLLVCLSAIVLYQ